MLPMRNVRRFMIVRNLSDSMISMPRPTTIRSRQR